jgi:short-chain fatty acids transporter
MPVVNWFKHPKEKDIFIIDPKRLEDEIPVKSLNKIKKGNDTCRKTGK